MMSIKSLQRGLVSASNEKEWVEKPSRQASLLQSVHAEWTLFNFPEKLD